MLERKVKKYRAAFSKKSFVATIPPPSGERSKPGGFQLITAMGLSDNKPKYNAVMVRDIPATSADHGTNQKLSWQRVVRSAIERAVIDHRANYKDIEPEKLAQIFAQVSHPP